MFGDTSFVKPPMLLVSGEEASEQSSAAYLSNTLKEFRCKSYAAFRIGEAHPPYGEIDADDGRAELLSRPQRGSQRLFSASVLLDERHPAGIRAFTPWVKGFPEAPERTSDRSQADRSSGLSLCKIINRRTALHRRTDSVARSDEPRRRWKQILTVHVKP